MKAAEKTMNCQQCGKKMNYRKSRKYCSSTCRANAHHERMKQTGSIKVAEKVLKEERSHGKNCSMCGGLKLPRPCPKCGRTVDKCYDWIAGQCLWCYVKSH